MRNQINSKILGATVVGIALIAGAYVVSSFKKTQPITQTASVQAANPTLRTAIAVKDKDDDGVEDWRDEFVTTAPIILNQESSTYTPPDTLTAKMSISFMENIILAKGYGAFGRTQEEIVASTVESISKEVELKLYNTSDISIMNTWDDEDLVNYANTAAATIYRHSIPDMESELVILKDYLSTQDESKLKKLELLANVYLGYRDDTLKIPVPALLAKEHLDLINTYNAIYSDIKAMSIASSDPTLALLHLKRYRDDSTGLSYALQNLYLALEPKAALFTADDPAALFVIFSPNYQN